MQLLELGHEIVARRFRRGQIAHEDVGDEGGPQRVGRTGRGDDRAGDLEHRSQKVTGELIIVDDQHVDALELGKRVVTHT